MSRVVNEEWDAFSNSINIDRLRQKFLFLCAFDVLILVVIYFALFFFYPSTGSSLLRAIHRPLHLSGVSLQSSDIIVEMFLRPDLSQG